DGSFGGMGVLQEVQMGHDVGERRCGSERKLTLLASATNERADCLWVQIGEGGARARLFLERPVLDEAFGDKVICQAFTHRAGEFRDIGEAAADELASGFANERQHLRLAALVVLALYIY